jgi:hypothetical protein
MKFGIAFKVLYVLLLCYKTVAWSWHGQVGLILLGFACSAAGITNAERGEFKHVATRFIQNTPSSEYFSIPVRYVFSSYDTTVSVLLGKIFYQNLRNKERYSHVGKNLRPIQPWAINFS